MIKNVVNILNNLIVSNDLKKSSINFNNFMDYNLWTTKILNELLNLHKINDSKNTLYIGTFTRDFFTNNKWIKKLFNVDNHKLFFTFWEAINNELKKKNNSLQNISKKFFNILKNNKYKFNKNYNNEELYLLSIFYIYKLFIFSSLEWILNEIKIIKSIYNYLEKYNLSNKIEIYDEITWYEDNVYCVDFALKEKKIGNIIVWFQVKPLSFIKSYNTTSKYSYNKIIKANNMKENYLKWKLGIHIIYYNNNNLFVSHINNINSNIWIEEFIYNIWL